jgi:Escherichia/Staphylococcus phage prohead protease
MSNQQHYRSFRPELEVRSGGDGRTIYGIAVPYNTPTRIDNSLVEQFARGAFNHQVRTPNRVKFAREHMMLGGELIGALSLMRDDPVGLYVEMRASRTPKGDETLELVKDGALNELSIMFRERQNRKLPGGILERVTADLGEVAVTMQGAYGDAAVAMGVRSHSGAAGDVMVADADLRLQAEEFLLGLPDLTDHEMRIRQLRLGSGF